MPKLWIELWEGYLREVAQRARRGWRRDVGGAFGERQVNVSAESKGLRGVAVISQNGAPQQGQAGHQAGVIFPEAAQQAAGRAVRCPLPDLVEAFRRSAPLL